MASMLKSETVADLNTGKRPCSQKNEGIKGQALCKGQPKITDIEYGPRKKATESDTRGTALGAEEYIAVFTRKQDEKWKSVQKTREVQIHLKEISRQYDDSISAVFLSSYV